MKLEQKKVREALLLLEEIKVISSNERGRMWSDYWNTSIN